VSEIQVSVALGDLVAANPAAARVLERYGLDYCCHGSQTLGEACAVRGIDADAVGTELGALKISGDTAWRELGPSALVDHIIAVHHDYLHEELPRLDALAAKVLDVHGDRHPELAEVQRLFTQLRNDLEPHLMKEERILFPAIKALLAGQREFPFGSIANPIRMMMGDHDRDGDLLRALRETTNGYAVPADACASYHSLYERLDILETDTHLHILKENHTLFPAVLALADA